MFILAVIAVCAVAAYGFRWGLARLDAIDAELEAQEDLG